MDHRQDLSPFDMQAILDEIAFPDFRFQVVRIGDSLQNALQIECSGADNVTGAPLTWKSRKWLLSPHMTRGEVVQTAFKAVMTAVEHETRELFTYRGQAVFDPHYDIDKLVALRGQADALVERRPGLTQTQLAHYRTVFGLGGGEAARHAVEGGSAGAHEAEFPASGEAEWDPQP